MLRRLFTLVSALSLLLCLATVALWVRSWSVADQILGGFATPTTHRITGQTVVLPGMAWSHYAGRLLISHFPALEVRKTDGHWCYRNPPVHQLISEVDNRVFFRPRLAFAGFRFGTVSDGEWNLLIPDYVIALSFAAAPLLWMASALRHNRRSAKGCCISCGYDLRATPDRCPECGTPVVPNAMPPKKPGISN